MLKRLRPWRAVYQSWYSPQLYREAALQWRGLAYQYLLFLLFVIWSVAALHLYFVLSIYVDGFLKPLLNDLPQFQLKKRIVVLERPAVETYQVKDPRTGRVLVDFDVRTTPQMPPVSQEGIFFRRTSVILHYKGAEEIVELKGDSEFSKEVSGSTSRILEAFERWFPVVVLGAFWIASFIFCAVQVLVYGMIGKLLAMLSRAHLSYAQLVRISVVSITPALLIDLIQKVTCFGLPMWSLLSVVLSLGFLLFGIKSNNVANRYLQKYMDNKL